MKKKIVLACLDDDKDFHFILEKSLLLWDLNFQYELLKFSEVNELLDYLLNNSDSPELLPSALLVEIHLPKMDGWQFIKFYEKIKDQLLMPPLVFVVTNSINRRDIDRARSMQIVSGYFEKPLDRKKFEIINNRILLLSEMQMFTV